MDIVRKRFNELSAMADRIDRSKGTGTIRLPSPAYFVGEDSSYEVSTQRIDDNLVLQWITSVKLLLFQVFGSGNPTYVEFEERARRAQVVGHSDFDALRAVFLSAREDFEGGYMFSVRNLVHASVFSDELEQARGLFDQGYPPLAAVVAGTVLETTLRELCDQHSIGISDRPSLNRMNDELAKAAVYNDSKKTQIQSWAKIRNSAAHGKHDEFTDADVRFMLGGIEAFVGDIMK